MKIVIFYLSMILLGCASLMSCNQNKSSSLRKILHVNGLSIGDSIDTTKFTRRSLSKFSLKKSYEINDSIKVDLDNSNRIWAIEMDILDKRTFEAWKEKLDKIGPCENFGGGMDWRFKDDKLTVEINKGGYEGVYYLLIVDETQRRIEVEKTLGVRK